MHEYQFHNRPETKLRVTAATQFRSLDCYWRKGLDCGCKPMISFAEEGPGAKGRRERPPCEGLMKRAGDDVIGRGKGVSVIRLALCISTNQRSSLSS